MAREKLTAGGIFGELISSVGDGVRNAFTGSAKNRKPGSKTVAIFQQNINSGETRIRRTKTHGWGFSRETEEIVQRHHHETVRAAFMHEAEPRSGFQRGVEAVFKGVLGIAHLFSKREEPREKPDSYFPRLPYQPVAADAEPKTRSEIEKSLDVIFGNADTKREDPDPTPRDSKPVGTMRDLLSSSPRRNGYKGGGLRPQPLPVSRNDLTNDR